MPLEKRRWFPFLCAGLAVSLVVLCWTSVRFALQAPEVVPGVALGLLSIGAFAGFNRLLELFLPLLLLKIWPDLER